MLFTTGSAFAEDKSYFCKATTSSIGDPSPSTLPAGAAHSLAYDLGTVGSCNQTQYSTNFQPSCQTPANAACSSKALADSDFNSAAFWCARGTPNGSTIRAYAAVGQPRTPASIDKGKYIAAQTKGVLINTPAVTTTTCQCPAGWWANTTNLDGGVTADGRCKKPACGPNTVVPSPADGTPIGSGSNPWGFSWGNAFYAWGTNANGGAASCTTVITTAAVCKWQ